MSTEVSEWMLAAAKEMMGFLRSIDWSGCSEEWKYKRMAEIIARHCPSAATTEFSCLLAAADEAETWIEHGINSGAVEWHVGLETLARKCRKWAESALASAACSRCGRTMRSKIVCPSCGEATGSYPVTESTPPQEGEGEK